jgi:hypothetical protein
MMAENDKNKRIKNIETPKIPAFKIVGRNNTKEEPKDNKKNIIKSNEEVSFILKNMLGDIFSTFNNSSNSTREETLNVTAATKNNTQAPKVKDNPLNINKTATLSNKTTISAPIKSLFDISLDDEKELNFTKCTNISSISNIHSVMVDLIEPFNTRSLPVVASSILKEDPLQNVTTVPSCSQEKNKEKDRPEPSIKPPDDYFPNRRNSITVGPKKSDSKNEECAHKSAEQCRIKKCKKKKIIKEGLKEAMKDEMDIKKTLIEYYLKRRELKFKQLNTPPIFSKSEIQK